jgi:hypothetical protein
VALAKTRKFIDAREEFYSWQCNYLSGATKLTPEEAVKCMEGMVKRYNDAVKAADVKVYKKVAFLIGGAALSVTSALITANPLPAVGVGLSVVQFFTLDRKPVVSPGRFAPAAMFHEAAKILGTDN